MPSPADLLPLLLTAGVEGGAAAADGAGGLWEQHGDKILVAVVTAILVLLVSEPLKALLGKAGRGLERWFQGMGWRFRKRYLAALEERHRWLKLIGVYNRADLHPPRLQEVYVSLRLAGGGHEEAGGRLPWHQAFGGEDRCVAILGGPGAGKSTLLDYLVLVLSGRIRHPLRGKMGEPLPLFARMRELGADEDRSSLLGLLRHSSPVSRMPERFPVRWLERGDCVVLLDGLDEVLDEEKHQVAAEAIQRLVADYPKNRFIVSCRSAGWRSQLPGFRTYEIQEFDEDDIRQFAGAWYREALRTQAVNPLGRRADVARLREAETEAYRDAGERSTELCEDLAGNPHLLRIARTPLILSLITLVHYYQVTRLPQGRAALYERCLAVLLELWDAKDKRLPKGEGPTLKDKLAVLQAVAYHYLDRNLLEADVQALEEVLEPVVGKLSLSLPVPELIEQIWQRSGVLVEQGLGRFGFAHRALHDYLAASYIVKHELDEILLPRANEERWREVILIAVGLAPPKRAERLVGAFLAAGEASRTALEMAGLSLGEDVELGADLRAEVRRRLLGRIEDEADAAAFAGLLGALRAADVEAAQDYMRASLTSGDPDRRRWMLSLVPELGGEGERLVPVLTQIAGGAEPAALRREAALALAKVARSPDGEVWEALREARRAKAVQVKTAANWAWCELGRHEELGLVPVPAGDFLMGSREGEGEAPEHPQHSIYLPRYYVGRYAVTTAEFREFVETSGHQPASRDSLLGQDNRPAVWVSWHDALAFARWRSCGLPSEAEWEKAARGTDGRQWPWGSTWRNGAANTREVRRWRRRLPLLRRVGSYTTAVGLFSPTGDSPYGCADMAGNVWEWTRSLMERYPYVHDDDREDLQASKELPRVLRGGSFYNPSGDARCACRYWDHPGDRDDAVGFRLVLSPFSSEL